MSIFIHRLLRIMDVSRIRGSCVIRERVSKWFRKVLIIYNLLPLFLLPQLMLKLLNNLSLSFRRLACLIRWCWLVLDLSIIRNHFLHESILNHFKLVFDRQLKIFELSHFWLCSVVLVLCYGFLFWCFFWYLTTAQKLVWKPSPDKANFHVSLFFPERLSYTENKPSPFPK